MGTDRDQASKTRLRLRGHRVAFCVSYKVTYETKTEALDAAERGMARGEVLPGCHLMPYECDACGKFHIANKHIVFREAR